MARTRLFNYSPGVLWIFLPRKSQSYTDSVVPVNEAAPEKGEEGIKEQQDKAAIKERVDGELYRDRGGPDEIYVGSVTGMKLLCLDRMKRQPNARRKTVRIDFNAGIGVDCFEKLKSGDE